SVKKTETGDDANYMFLNSDSIINPQYIRRQSSVELTWETSGGDHDYFRILRRKHTTDANARWTDTIATNLNQLYYEDKTVLIQQSYDYRVESVYQCEGTHVDGGIISGASCEPTGMIEGYVRMADGTAMAGVTVECRPGDNVMGASARYTTTTDDTGYYVFRNLPYQTNGTYYVTIPTTGDQGSYTSPNAQGQVSFTNSSNWTEDFNFFLDTYYVYSGNVYYRNTSIPVPGVSFRLDGELMHDASRQPIVTDTQGGFELSIPSGAHTVQAVKEGHRFANDGFLINHDAVGDSTLYNFAQNVAGVYLWDSTTVVLRGRVVGGDVEGKKMLGLSQSKNNLGDSLKIVMQLEGDNTSWLIRRQDDESVKSDSYKVAFGMDDKDTTRVDVTRHMMTIRPDKKTGEYQLMVPPVKYKVTEVSAEGYATLFQHGKVGETLDLTFRNDGDTCEYSRIYHAMPTVEVKQFNAKSEPYFGVKRTTAADNIGNKAEIQLWSESKGYAFGNPVFMAGSPYGWMLQACEKYYWNNNDKTVPDIVNLNGGTVNIKNLMVSSNGTEQSDSVKLDNQGYGSYVFTPANVTSLLDSISARKSVSITLKYDGNYYDVLPLNGKMMSCYVMATTPKTEGIYTVAASYPQLIDILRDPPGSGSSSYIEAGSKLSYTYSPTFEGTLGFALSNISGTMNTIYTGAVAISPTTGAGTNSGTVSEAYSEKTFAFSLASTYNGSWVTSYEFDVNERIQTRTGQRWVGPDADLFMGTNEQIIIQDAIAVRVIPEDQYQLIKNHEGGSFPVTYDNDKTATVNVKVGSMKVLAQGRDVATGKNVYLVRDEVMGIRNQVKSTFIHSQSYIEKELLPQLLKLRNSLITAKGSISESDAQTKADKTHNPVYVSTVEESDPNFGGTSYVTMYLPKGSDTTENRVLDLNQQMGYWLSMLAQNEEEKVNVQESNRVKNYDIDGGVAALQYSENFTASRNISGFIKWPGLSNANIASLFPSWAKPIIEEISEGQDANTVRDVDNNSVELVTAIAGSGYKLKLTPIVSFNFSDKSSENKTQTKKVGFTLSASPRSNLNVDVYRTRNGKYAISEDDYQKNDIVYDEMLKMTVDVLDELRYGQPYHPDEDIEVYSSFVFRTRGGITNKPYEDERKTKWYQPGTIIDVATVPLDKPSIWIEQPVVSNVPFNEPARFVVHMANESAFPDQASISLMYFLESGCNPKGAKVCVDGKVLNSTNEPVYF
ncbi:MAG: carboxypeptidase regulatory-like domain-containing protein, partial [Prevotella sp.]|nr:carboxypeptidase regulatory-like domain-containing protein [Prevotella sp.]